MPSNFPHIPFLSTLYLRLEFFFSLFFSCRPGRKWKKCLFFGAWAIWKQSLSLFLFFSSHSQCSHLLSQGNAVTGTFAQAVAIWWKRRKMERERQREEERRGSFGCNQSTILQTQKKKQRSWQLTADSAVRRLKAKLKHVKQFWSGQKSCQNDNSSQESLQSFYNGTTTSLSPLISFYFISRSVFYTALLNWKYLSKTEDFFVFATNVFDIKLGCYLNITEQLPEY